DAERPALDPRRDTVSHPVQLTRRHARALGRGEPAGVRAGALIGNPGGCDRGGDVGGGADLSGRDSDDGKEAQPEGAVALDPNGMNDKADAETPRRPAAVSVQREA